MLINGTGKHHHGEWNMIGVKHDGLLLYGFIFITV